MKFEKYLKEEDTSKLAPIATIDGFLQVCDCFVVDLLNVVDIAELVRWPSILSTLAFLFHQSLISCRCGSLNRSTRHALPSQRGLLAIDPLDFHLDERDGEVLLRRSRHHDLGD